MNDDKENISRLFRSYDLNGDGVLSKEEFEVVLKAINFEGDVDDLMEMVDCDDNGVVSYEELVAWMFGADESDATLSFSPSERLAAEMPRLAELPAQLEQLPASKLRDVFKALEQLHELGLGNVDDIKMLREKMKVKAGIEGEQLPIEGLTSEYMGMCLWAWTRARWMKSVDLKKPMCKLSGASPVDEVQYESQLMGQAELVKSSFDWDAEAPKRVARARVAFERMVEKAQQNPRAVAHLTKSYVLGTPYTVNSN